MVLPMTYKNPTKKQKVIQYILFIFFAHFYSWFILRIFKYDR